MSYCKITPTIKNKEGKEVDSKLFKDLFNLTKDRELTKKIWGLTQVPGFLNSKSVELDENGEITLDSLQTILNIEELLDEKQQMSLKTQQAGFTDKNGNSIVVKNIHDLTDRVVKFNEENSSYVATIYPSSTKNGYEVKVEEKTINNTSQVSDLKFKSILNKKLLGILNSLGFDVSFTEDENLDGVFNPLLAKESAENLKTIIQVATPTKEEIEEEQSEREELPQPEPVVEEAKPTEQPKKPAVRTRAKGLENIAKRKAAKQGVDGWILQKQVEIAAIAKAANFNGVLSSASIKGMLESNGFTIDNIKDIDDLMNKIEYVLNCKQ